MSHLTPLYSANRALREYTENYYLPGAAAVRERSGDRGALGRLLVQWREELSKHWSRVRFGQVRVETSAAKHTFSVEVYLGDLASQSVKVQLYADGRSPSLIDMACGKPLAGPEKGHVYTAEVPTSRPASDYTARVIPLHPAARVPLEDAHILWSR
jgi:starch phosphorylase